MAGNGSVFKKNQVQWDDVTEFKKKIRPACDIIINSNESFKTLASITNYSKVGSYLNPWEHD